MKLPARLIPSESLPRECLGVFAAVVAAYLLLRSSALFLVGAFNDDGAYVMLGKSLADGTGYRLMYLVGAPVAVKSPPVSPHCSRSRGPWVERWPRCGRR